VEEALRESEEKFRVLAETSPVAICIYQGEKIIYANPATERLFGYSVDELRRMSFWSWAREDFREMVRDRGEARLRGEVVPAQYESCYVTKAGEDKFALVSAGMMEYQGRPTGVVFFLDITERKRAEELVRDSLAEKEVLLREIHHRVKNNLQVVSSLLYLQSQKLADPELQSHFLESQSRICSMALAHEQLYQSKSLAEVSVRSYVESLVGQLSQVFQLPEQQIDCRTQIDDIVLDIEQVVPCGLLITELVSNAYKHAFTDGRNGTITVSMEKVGERLVLSVADDGLGLPADLDFRNATTLGLQLVAALVAQLNGTLELEKAGGALFRVIFAETIPDSGQEKKVAESLL
jgi:PAS domain S-box-containing protein